MAFDSKQYSYADISIAFGGRILEGITEIEYEKKLDKSYLSGRGSKPHGILHGNFEFGGKVKIWQSELESMTKDAPDKEILLLVFDIIVSYVPKDGGQTVTDVLKGVEFDQVKKGMKTGDKNMEIELPIMFLDVKSQQ